MRQPPPIFVFFFNDTATTEIYTLSLHDALPISRLDRHRCPARRHDVRPGRHGRAAAQAAPAPGNRVLLRAARPPGGRARRRRSEEHTSELQSRQYLVCRLLLEKKKKTRHTTRPF